MTMGLIAYSRLKSKRSSLILISVFAAYFIQFFSPIFPITVQETGHPTLLGKSEL